MKKLNYQIYSIVIILFCFLMNACQSMDTQNNYSGVDPKSAVMKMKSENVDYKQVRTTAYTHSEKDHKRYGKKTASGSKLKCGDIVSVATDWSFLPLGTRFKISGDSRIFVVEDYGSALVGTKTIDIYHSSFSSMKKWGTRHVDIKIISGGSFADSLRILKARSKYRHCRKMISLIQKIQDTNRSW